MQSIGASEPIEADVLQTASSNQFSCNNFAISIKISLKFVPKGPIDKTRA